jgi:hypothetical protein
MGSARFIDPSCARAFVALVLTEEEHSHESVRKMFEYALRATHFDNQDPHISAKRPKD